MYGHLRTPKVTQSASAELDADVQAIEEALTPRLGVTGEMATLTKFKEFFHGKSLEKGTNILLLWKTEGVLDVVAKSHTDSQDYSQVCAHCWLRASVVLLAPNLSFAHWHSACHSTHGPCSAVN